jgi:hypothetical protein
VAERGKGKGEAVEDDDPMNVTDSDQQYIDELSGDSARK